MKEPTKLIIARHGNTFGPGDIVRRVGKTDLPLVESGLLQGQTLGQYLKDNELVPKVIFTSNLQRTRQTAEQIQSAIGIKTTMQPLSIFDEIDYGPDENQPEEQVISRIGKQALKEWEDHAVVPDDWNFNPQETIQHWHQFADRIEDQYEGEIVLVVTSNGIARFAPYLTGDFKSFCKEHTIKIATGALSIFEKNQEQPFWNCVAWNIKP